MMVSGIPTASGFEERIRFSEIEIVDANAIDTGVLTTLPEGNYLNGWDVNVAGVRTISVKRKLRHHQHAVSYIIIQGYNVKHSVADEGPAGVYTARQKEERTRILHWTAIRRLRTPV
jgi:hypothetical protein